MNWLKKIKSGTNVDNIDSLLSKVFKIYNELSKGKIDNYRCTLGIQLCDKAISLCEDSEEKNKLALCYNFKGSFLRLNHNLPMATELNEKALKIIRDISPKSEFEGQILNNLSELHREMYFPDPISDDNSNAHFIKALEYSIESCEYFINYNKSSENYPLSLYTLGRICGEYGDTGTANILIRKAMHIFTNFGNMSLVQHCKISLNALNESINQTKVHKELFDYIIEKREDKERIKNLFDKMKEISKKI